MVDNDTLLRQVAEGDEGALEELVECNMGLVKSVALRFRDRGTEYEDLVQIGAIGLLRAARSFDFSFGCMFSTYAVPLIIGEIRRHLRDDGIIKVSRTIRTRAVHLMREREQFTRREGREPTVGELGELTGYTAEEIVTALDAAGPVRSLSETVGGEDGAPLECFIADPDAPLDRLTDHIALEQAIRRLSPDQQQIIRLRYFHRLSQQQVGNALGLSQVKVSREEKKILGLLREAL